MHQQNHVAGLELVQETISNLSLALGAEAQRLAAAHDGDISLGVAVVGAAGIQMAADSVKFQAGYIGVPEAFTDADLRRLGMAMNELVFAELRRIGELRDQKDKHEIQNN
jgi:hypothetical protein